MSDTETNILPLELHLDFCVARTAKHTKQRKLEPWALFWELNHATY